MVNREKLQRFLDTLSDSEAQDLTKALGVDNGTGEPVLPERYTKAAIGLSIVARDAADRAKNSAPAKILTALGCIIRAGLEVKVDELGAIAEERGH